MKENTINFKENLNNFNLPTTWTKKKITSLFLMGWLLANGVETGQNFKDCLGDSNYEGIIQLNNVSNVALTTYGWTSSCLNGQCSGIPAGSLPMADLTFQCAKVGQSTFCVTNGYSKTGMFGGLCGGILGDTPAINSPVVGATDCPLLGMVANSLVTGPTTNSVFT
jgi:hypothetical protein